MNAIDLVHKLFTVDEALALAPGQTLALFYPQWEPASHAPTGDVTALAGLSISSHGRALEWHRDPIRPHAFIVTVAKDASVLQIHFDYLSPQNGAIAMSSAMVNVQWQRLVLYPADRSVDQLRVAARVS